MLNIFKSKKRELCSPADGEVILLEEVEDEVFSQKMMGDGFAVIPSNNQIVSPCNGEVLQVFNTKHAIVIRDEFGLELIIHVGLDTVKLKGEGFDVKVVKGQMVKRGELLLNVDLEFLEKNQKQIVTPVIITNMDKVTINKRVTGKQKANTVVLTFSQ